MQPLPRQPLQEKDMSLEIEGVQRIENRTRDELLELCSDMTHSVYPHDEVYGDFCPIQSYIDCPPEDVFRYLSSTAALSEWTCSLRNPVLHRQPDLYEFIDRISIGDKPKCYCRTVVNAEAMTVDYHCAWDQPDHLWMIYMLRVVPAQLVLNKPGSVVLWVNCHHPFYQRNPFPEAAPDGRKFWVGDAWHMFYAG